MHSSTSNSERLTNTMCPSQSLDFNQTEVIQIDVHAGILSELLCCHMANRGVFSPNILQDFRSVFVHKLLLSSVLFLSLQSSLKLTNTTCLCANQKPTLCVPRPESETKTIVNCSVTAMCCQLTEQHSNDEFKGRGQVQDKYHKSFISEI